MSAGVLREAAQLMREHNPPCCGHGDVCCQGVDFHLAVADWLETIADLIDTHMLNGAPTPVGYAVTGPALAVARAYLGRDS